MGTHHLLLFAFLYVNFAFALASAHHQPVFSAIFAFGDSFTDTGNLLIASNYSENEVEQYLPYGSAFFHKPTGRFSNGRLVIDFLAQRLRAPLLKPFLSISSPSGSPKLEDRFVDFAVAGAPAQSAAFLKNSLNITVAPSVSLDVQLKWFKQFQGEAKELQLSNVLIFFGEFGYNDYYTPILAGIPYETIFSSVSNVIKQIKTSLQKLIKDGVKYIVVQGVPPMGCSPNIIRSLSSSPKDQFGCIQSMNKLSHKHNRQLQQIIRDLSTDHPHVKIVYFDFERAYTEVIKHARNYGITNTTGTCFDVLNFVVSTTPFNLTAFREVKACPHPSEYISWDGVHLTEAMARVLTNLFFDKGFVDPYPNFLTMRLG